MLFLQLYEQPSYISVLLSQFFDLLHQFIFSIFKLLKVYTFLISWLLGGCSIPNLHHHLFTDLGVQIRVHKLIWYKLSINSGQKFFNGIAFCRRGSVWFSYLFGTWHLLWTILAFKMMWHTIFIARVRCTILCCVLDSLRARALLLRTGCCSIWTYVKVRDFLWQVEWEWFVFYGLVDFSLLDAVIRMEDVTEILLIKTSDSALLLVKGVPLVEWIALVVVGLVSRVVEFVIHEAE